MKVFLSSTYTELIEHRIIPTGNKAAHDILHTAVNRRAIFANSAKAD